MNLKNKLSKQEHRIMDTESMLIARREVVWGRGEEVRRLRGTKR